MGAARIGRSQNRGDYRLYFHRYTFECRWSAGRNGDGVCHQYFETGAADIADFCRLSSHRSEEHTSELQSLMRISYAVFCLTKKNIYTIQHQIRHIDTRYYQIR